MRNAYDFLLHIGELIKLRVPACDGDSDEKRFRAELSNASGLDEEKGVSMCYYYVPQLSLAADKYDLHEGSRNDQREFIMERVRAMNKIREVTRYDLQHT